MITFQIPEELAHLAHEESEMLYEFNGDPFTGSVTTWWIGEVALAESGDGGVILPETLSRHLGGANKLAPNQIRVLCEVAREEGWPTFGEFLSRLKPENFSSHGEAHVKPLRPA